MIGYSIVRLQIISRITRTVADRPHRFGNPSTKKDERMTTCMETLLHMGRLSISQGEVMLKVFSLKAIFWDAESVV